MLERVAQELEQRLDKDVPVMEAREVMLTQLAKGVQGDCSNASLTQVSDVDMYS